MIDINCDMGEGMGNDADLMPYVYSANIACGFHAGDEKSMREMVTLCLEHNVNIGAHPSFYDRENFGRVNIQLSESMIHDLITVQLLTINNIVNDLGGKLQHVKPHGALYNMAAKDQMFARAIAITVKDFDPALVYYGLSGSVMIDEAEAIGLRVLNEVFADRTYQRDGSLTPRTEANALINDTAAVLAQVDKLVKEQKVKTVTGEEIYVKAQTICIHGDGAHALEFAKAIHKSIHEK